MSIKDLTPRDSVSSKHSAMCGRCAWLENREPIMPVMRKIILPQYNGSFYPIRAGWDVFYLMEQKIKGMQIFVLEDGKRYVRLVDLFMTVYEIDEQQALSKIHEFSHRTSYRDTVKDHTIAPGVTVPVVWENEVFPVIYDYTDKYTNKEGLNIRFHEIDLSKTCRL